MKEELKESIELPENVSAKLEGTVLTLSGPKGEVSRGFAHPKVTVEATGNTISLSVTKSTRREKKIFGAFIAHIKNSVTGVQEPHVYKLKICSGHFPMNVTVTGEEVQIKNFLGESVPRRAAIIPGAEIKINGTEIVVTSPDREAAGQMAARIESLCRITNRDRRIFQDGCYIVSKAGRVLA
jgi:large subunit ribosomal protein L6